MAMTDPQRVAIVTGTSAGLGEAVAQQLLERDWRVVGIARRPSPIAHERYRHIACDLATVATDPASLELQLGEHLRGVGTDRFGLVNNAAAPDGLMPIAKLDPRAVARVYAVNVVAPMWLMGYAVRVAPSSAALRIVNVSSGAATSAFAGLATYGGSKAALRMGGMALFTSLLARLALPSTVNALVAFVTGVISTYSSTSGVVLPAFLPMVPGLVRELGGGDPLAIALSINVGASIVDVSPLSTLGALCVAAIADPEASKDLFRRLMIWGLSMTVVGALLCGVFAGPFARL